MKKLFFYKTCIGEIGIAEDGKAITDVFMRGIRAADETEYSIEETELISKASSQLNEYLSGDRKIFELPLSTSGTPFQEGVWRELARIPYGETRTYGDIAEATGNPGAARAVGQACGRNPILVIIPCHRAVGAGGRIGGYAGVVGVKEWLLGMESGGHFRGYDSDGQIVFNNYKSG